MASTEMGKIGGRDTSVRVRVRVKFNLSQVPRQVTKLRSHRHVQIQSHTNINTQVTVKGNEMQQEVEKGNLQCQSSRTCERLPSNYSIEHDPTGHVTYKWKANC